MKSAEWGTAVIHRRDGATGKNWTGSTELDRPKSKKVKGRDREGRDRVQSAGQEKLQSACRTGQGEVRQTGEVAVRLPDRTG